jgi:hypothetical protein
VLLLAGFFRSSLNAFEGKFDFGQSGLPFKEVTIFFPDASQSLSERGLEAESQWARRESNSYGVTHPNGFQLHSKTALQGIYRYSSLLVWLDSRYFHVILVSGLSLKWTQAIPDDLRRVQVYREYGGSQFGVLEPRLQSHQGAGFVPALRR